MRRRFFGIKFFLAAFCGVITCLAVLASPYFSIKALDFSGHNVYSEAFLSSRMGLDPGGGDSIFYRSARGMERQLEALPYIKHARVAKQFPGTLEVAVTERIPRALVLDEKLNIFLTICDNAYVLGINDRLDSGLPVISGIKLAGYSVGHELVSDGGVNQMTTVTRLSMILARYGSENISRVDISDPADIKLFINNVTVRIGSMDGAEEKILMALSCVEAISPVVTGTLHAYNTNSMHLSIGR
ncbi:MAG: FtsQ-type POTRA domain-containing protein [Defluviitaleaceae bacterium]|nr:FtsQ-type POTRA domain-containing protein [Defluviitaleaceae bacterium]MCL2835157.1 FtsQ-type POTRA domain-containing protein [Defluviitaleaceae bacterium]